MKRAVLFDFGGVIIHQDWGEYDRQGRALGLGPGELRRILYRTDEWRALQVGAGDRPTWEAACIRELAAHIGEERSRAFFAEWWARPWELHHHNLELARRLQQRGVLIGILSNAAADLQERLPQMLPPESMTWDDVVISGLVGLAKPDEQIYRLAAARLGIEPEGCFFIDDLEHNVAAARGTGMAGHFFQGDYEALVRDLLEAGYPV
jgi:putative hydrolase of the HAD superfamily